MDFTRTSLIPFLHKLQTASPLVPAVLAYTVLAYSHLSSRNLAQAADKPSIRNVIIVGSPIYRRP